MAMDSHDDDHYELLVIDSANNNHNEKSGGSSSGRNGNPECSSHVSSHAVGTLSGSSRRKYSTLSKGITIEEFLETDNQNNQLTAIDKLILKNKAALALAEDQMKRVRVKSKDKPTTTQRKADRNTKTKVLSSKLANSKHGRKLNNANGKNKNGVVRPKNSKTKIATKVVADKAKKIVKSFSKAEKTEARTSHSESKSKTESRPQHSDLKVKTETRTLNGDTKSKAPKKPAVAETKAVKGGEKVTMNRKTLLQSVRKTKKEPKINCKSFDMKRLKSNVAYRTRSVNNEKLRNGKTRIIRELPEERLPETKKKNSKAKDETPVSGVVTAARASLKRPIKEEPQEEGGPARKRKNSAPSAASLIENSNADADIPNIAQPMNVEGSSKSEIFVKEEPLKKEIVTESKPLNADTSIASNNLASTADDKPEPKNAINFPENAPTPCEVVTENNGQVVDVREDDKHLLVDSVMNDVEGCTDSQDDDTSENLNLQLDNLDDDIEEIEVDNQSCHSMDVEIESIIDVVDETDEKNEDTKEELNFPVAVDDSARDSIFSALGLQSIERNSQKSKEKETKDENYRGTLKMVIKTDKGSGRMEMKPSDHSSSEPMQNENVLFFHSKNVEGEDDRIISNRSPAERSDSSGMSSLFVEDDADRDEVKTNISDIPIVNPPVKKTTSICNGDAARIDVGKSSSDKAKGEDVSLIVPEKSSSFSIHPNRLCSDVCKYCFGKFGSLDTPCHVGQIKNLELRKKILNSEPNLRIDTCLCDACFRHVDRKANRPKRRTKTTGKRNTVPCSVQNCNQIAWKIFTKRRWRSKICRKFANLSFDAQRRTNGSGLALCSHHYSMVNLYTSCGICKKKLNRNDMYSVRPGVKDLNDILQRDGIPIKLLDNMLLCKYCHHCTSLRLSFGDPSQMSKSNKDYYESFRNEVLRFLRVTNGDGEPKDSSENQKTETTEIAASDKVTNQAKEKADDNRSLSNVSVPVERDINTTASKKTHTVGLKDIASLLKPLESEHSNEKNSTHIQLKFGNLNIRKLSNLNIGQNTQSLPAPAEKKNESPSEDAELSLKADFSFDNDDASRGWERCVSTIQFDKSTKKLWQDLQKPYGNQSSFIRHLIMLEKYWRNGALVLSDSADPAAVKYVSSVKNRIESLEVFSAPKLPPVPALAPAPAAVAAATPAAAVVVTPPIPQPTQQKLVVRKLSEKLTSILPPSQPAPKPAQPPPLLKLNCLSPFLVRKSAPICTVRPSPEFSIKTVRTSLPAPPKLERIPSVYMNTAKSISMSTLRGMVQQQQQHQQQQQQIPPKQQIMQVESLGKGRAISVMKKSPSTTNGTASVVRTFPSHFLTKPITTVKKNSSPSSTIIISKLPKTLTVTQIDDKISKDRKDSKPSPILTPFLAGEKPSVSVFREITK